MKEVDILKDHADPSQYLVRSHIPHIHAAQPHSAPGHIPESGGQPGDSGLAGAGGPHQGSNAPGRELEGNVMEHFFFPVGK